MELGVLSQNAMLADLRYALRALRRNPTFAIVAILSIALGIGANSAMFSLADAMLLRPLPVENPSQVVNLRWQLRGQQFSGVSYPDFADYRDKTRAFSGLTAFQLNRYGFAKDRRELPAMKAGLAVSGAFFDVLGVRPQLGRTFRLDEDTVPGRDAVVVISDDLWREQFASDPGVIGRKALINGIEFTVIGVAPRSFYGVDQYIRPALYVPLAMQGRLTGDTNNTLLTRRDLRAFTVKGRLAPGVSAKEADAEARVIASGLAQAYPDTNRNWSAAVRTELQSRIDMSPVDAIIAAMMFGLAAIVLLVACANAANLMIGRGLARTREFAVRMAIGAGRSRLVRQLLTESLVMALAAAGAGILIAQFSVDLFSPIKVPSDIPITIEARIDTRAMLYAIFAAVSAAVLSGLLPALRATRAGIAGDLKAGGGATGPRRRFLGRNALVVAQVAGSLLLLVCASQVYRGVNYMLAAPPGFRSQNMLMASFDPSLARYTEDKAQQFYKRLVENARQIPGVASAALAGAVPMANSSDSRLIVPEGFQMPPGKDALGVSVNVVTEDYFTTAGIPIIRGRAFRETDDREAPLVAVVNEAFAAHYYPGQDAVGKRFRLNGPQGPWVEIVGIAKMSKYYTLAEPPQDFFYLPLAQNPRMPMTLMLSTAGASASVTQPLLNLVRELDADQPVFSIRTMEEYFDQRATMIFRMFIGMLGGMGLLALALALSGLYAVMAWSVARRRREIGIRMAVGADRACVLRMVLRQGLTLSVVGSAAGLVLAIAFGRVVMANVGLPSYNVPTLVGVVVALIAITLLGAYVPARRAAQLDPVSVLKHE